MSQDQTLVRDVVVVIPGIMGSELRDRDNTLVWGVSPGLLVRALRRFRRFTTRLTLPDGIGDEAPDDGITATALVNSLHVIPGLWSPITGYDGLLDFLRSKRFHLVEQVPGDDGIIPNLIPFPYDWRLSNRLNGRRLAARVLPALERWRAQPGMQDARLILVCHSMGGLVARWFAEHEGGAEHVRAIVTIGTPHRGSLRALTTLHNGLEPGLGPLRFDLTDLVRSLPSLHQLLPTYNCIARNDARHAISVDAGLQINDAMLRDAQAFHAALSAPPSCSLLKVVGIRQPTLTTAVLHANGSLEGIETIDGEDNGGDGTVPRLAASPTGQHLTDVFEVAAQHGELQGTRALLDLVDGRITREDVIWQSAPGEQLGVRMREVWSSAEAPQLEVTGAEHRKLWVRVRDELGTIVQDRVRVGAGRAAQMHGLPEGGYRAEVYADAPTNVMPVSKPFLVLDPDEGTGA